MWRIGVAAAAAAFIGLVACTQDPQTQEAENKIYSGEVVLAATAADGTKLWEAFRSGHLVFFSSTGTNYTESSGKTTRGVEVPNSPARN